AHLAQPLAALVREPDLRSEPEQVVALVEQAEGAGADTARLEHDPQRWLEHVLGRGGAGGDLAQPAGEARGHRILGRTRTGRAAADLGPRSTLHAASFAPTPRGQAPPAGVLPTIVGRKGRPLEGPPGPAVYRPPCSARTFSCRWPGDASLCASTSASRRSRGTGRLTAALRASAAAKPAAVSSSSPYTSTRLGT